MQQTHTFLKGQVGAVLGHSHAGHQMLRCSWLDGKVGCIEGRMCTDIPSVSDN